MFARDLPFDRALWGKDSERLDTLEKASYL